MRFIFVRHGDPDYERDTLTEKGEKQAENTAKRLLRENIKKIYASPMGRAQKTASYTAKLLDLPIETLDFMHEITWGNPDGDEVFKEGHPWTLSYKLLTREDSVKNSAAWRDHPYFKENTVLESYDMISKEIDGLLKTQGYERRDDRYFCTRKNDDTIVLFSHGGSGACAQSHILNISFAYILSVLPFGVCSVSIIDFPSDVGEAVVPRIELFNDMNHVEEHSEYRFEK